MKKRIAMMMIAMAVTFGSVPVSAAQSDAVWLDAENAQITDANVSVPVGTNGETADGVIEITYDTSVLSIAEDAVKVSYLSEDNMDSGQFLSLNFQIKEGADAQAVKNALNSMKLSGTVYSEGGNEIVVGNSGSQTPGGNDNPGEDNPSGGDKPGNSEEPGNGEEPGGSTPGDSNPSGNGNNNQTTNQDTQNNTAESDQKKAGNASTGDNTNLMFPGVLAVAGAGAAGAAVYFAKTKKKEEE